MRYRLNPFTGIFDVIVSKASEVNVEELGSATYDDVQDYINFFGDRTLLSGGAISDNGNGTATVALGTAWAKETDSDTAVGKFFDFSADASVALTDLITNYIYLDYNGGTPPQIVVSTDILTHGFKQDHIHIGTIFRNGTTLHFHQEDNIGIGRVNIVDMYHLEKGDAERASGLMTTDAGSLALSITAGVIYEGLSRHATTVNGSTWSTWYYNFTTSLWVEVTGQAVINNTQYNLISSGVGLATLTSNRYAVHWVYCDIDGENLHIVYGQGNHTAAEAEDAAVPSLLPNLVTNYGVLIAKIVVQKSDTTLIIAYPWTSAFTSSLATDHGSLAGLADDDHPQYIKDSEFTADSDILVGTGSGTFAAETGATLRTSIGLGNVENTAHSADAHTMAIDGRDVSVDGSKLDGIEALADVTDAVNIASSIVGVADKATPADADSIALIDSEAANVLKELTWTNIKAFLKTYFDTLYNKYVHPNHSGEVTSAADGAQTIANKQTMSATAPITLSNTPTVVAGAAPVIAIPAATNAAAGHATAAHITAIEANTAKTIDDTAYNATSWDANSDAATKNAVRDKIETMDTAIGLNTAKDTNVSTDLSEGTSTTTTVAVNSSDGTNATLVSASTTRAGLLTKAKWDEIVANTAAKHTQGTDVALGAVGTKDPPIDADKALYRDSTDSDALVTSTWTQVKAFLKTYFDTLYNKYVHPNHSGEVTSVADGATTIATAAVTLAKMADMATASLLGRNTAGVGVPEVLSKATALSLLNVADGADVTGSNAPQAHTASHTDGTDDIQSATNAQKGVATAAQITALEANTAKVTNATHSGEVTGATELTITNDAVTYAKMQNVSATDKVLGRATAGAGDVEEIACTAFARSILDDADEATFKATVNLEIGTDVQAYDATLAVFSTAAVLGTL